jgi:hypothetical protein
MFRMLSAALTLLLALSLTSPVRAQDLQRGDPQDAGPAPAGATELDRDIAIRDSTRTAVAEDQALIQVDQARLDSLQAALVNARESTPRDAVAVTRTAAAVKETKRAVAHDVDHARRERMRLAAIEKKVTRESGATVGRSTLSAVPDSATRR